MEEAIRMTGELFFFLSPIPHDGWGGGGSPTEGLLLAQGRTDSALCAATHLTDAVTTPIPHYAHSASH